MIRPRVIPCLLVRNKGLVKTVKFEEGKYVGDPINAVRIFNEKEVDEIMVLDIDATREGREPDLAMIQKLATECRMPLCYGGGVKTADKAQQIFELGVEKVAVSAAALERPEIVSEMAERVGTQSVVVVLDVKKKMMGTRYEVYTHNASRRTRQNPVELARKFEQLGAGEIVLNSIDNDGVMKGYDFKLIDQVRAAINIPMSVLGGAGSLEDVGRVIERYGLIGAAAGSIFVFKGKYKAVLINYPNKEEKDAFLERYYRPMV